MYGNNSYYQPKFQATNMYQPQMPQIQQTQPQFIPTPQPIQQLNLPGVLQGKIVDSIDVVKATDIPLDGSISYFPLTDGSTIITKQLNNDGTSKTIIYKPVEEEQKEEIKYVTSDELKKSLKEIDLSDIDDLKDEIKELKKEIKDIKKSNKKDD